MTICISHMGQGIQGWTKYNLWKTAFKKFEVIWSAETYGDMVSFLVFLDVYFYCGKYFAVTLITKATFC